MKKPVDLFMRAFLLSFTNEIARADRAHTIDAIRKVRDWVNDLPPETRTVLVAFARECLLNL